jgi:hypothetical protein
MFLEKFTISLGSALLFLIIALPQTFQLTNTLLGGFVGDLWDQFAQCPTNLGNMVHAAVFFVLTFLSMRNPMLDTMTKVKHSLQGTVLYFILTHPFVYKTVGGLLNNVVQIADMNGCPTAVGAAVHALVYALVLTLLMYL